MADIRELRGVGDIRTALSGRLRSRPAQKGTAHRDLYLLGEERRRLEQEIWRLKRQQWRAEARLAETVQAIARLQQAAEQEDKPPGTPPVPIPGEQASEPFPQRRGRQWKKITLGY